MIRGNVFTLMLVLLVTLFSLSNTSHATVVVGLVHDGRVYIGSDSAGVSNKSIMIRADTKVFKINDGQMIIGFSGSFRMGQILHYDCEIIKQKVGQNLMEYMVTKFITSVRECFSEGGFASKRDERETGGFFLVGYRGRLFNVQDDYQVAESELPYQAIGAGSDLALGSLHTTAQGEYMPKERIEKALAAAAKFNTAVSPPFRHVALPSD